MGNRNLACSLANFNMKYLLLTIVLSACLTVGLADYGCPMEDVDFQGNSVEVIEGVESWQDCGELCKLTNRCQFWTLCTGPCGDYPGNTCQLKDSDSGLEKQSERISGELGCPE